MSAGHSWVATTWQASSRRILRPAWRCLRCGAMQLRLAGAPPPSPGALLKVDGAARVVDIVMSPVPPRGFQYMTCEEWTVFQANDL